MGKVRGRITYSSQRAGEKHRAQGFWSTIGGKHRWSKAAVQSSLRRGGGEGADLLVPLILNPTLWQRDAFAGRGHGRAGGFTQEVRIPCQRGCVRPNRH